MKAIPGGYFVMGDVFTGTNIDALPTHRVQLDIFFIGTYEITFAQYNAYARDQGRPIVAYDSTLSANHPVTAVSWDDAKAYCQYWGYRLPTEEEWEYAARSGGKKQQFAGTNNADSLYKYATTAAALGQTSFSVGIKKPNELGLYDMSGNVWEWVGRYYQRYPKNGAKANWDDFSVRSMRIIRGGSYRHGTQINSTIWRAGKLHTGKADDVGFRCAADQR